MSELVPWTPEWKEQELQKIRRSWGGCVLCEDLCESRNKVVCGRGNPDADVMIVGISPGSDEDKSGKPFTGPSGECLNSMLESMGVSRDDVFVDNILACHPPEDREPLKEEKEHCAARLYETIYIVDPMLIICAGKVPLQFFIGSRAQSIDSMLGKVTKAKVPGRKLSVEYDVTAIYHPSFILKNDTPDKHGYYAPDSYAERTYQALERMFTIAHTLRGEYDEHEERIKAWRE